MPRNNDIIEIDGQVYAETPAAYLFSDGTLKRDEYGNIFPVKTWVPKSQCDWSPSDRIMQMPEWLALEKGLI